MDIDSKYISSFKSVMENMIDNKLNKLGITNYISAIVQKINDDGTVDVFLPPDKTNLVTGIFNRCGEILSVGDSVEISTKNGSLTNSWVFIKHGTNINGNYDKLQEINSEVVVKVLNGRLVTSQLGRDTKLGNALTITADDINLDGININLNGTKGITISSPYFNVTNTGSLGATRGKIGGWNLDDTKLYSGSGSNYISLDSGTSGQNYVMWAGNESPSSAPFRLTRAGALNASNVTISGDITATSGTFNGVIHASGGSFSGNISASGTISGGTISGANISGGTISGISINGNDIASGTLSADKISGGTINGTNVNITNLNANNITGGSLNADRISGGTISSSSISIGGSSHYLRMGPGWTSHPEVSGLNVGGGGINMGGSGISHITSMSFNGQGSISTDTWPFVFYGPVKATGIYLGNGGFTMYGTGSTSETMSVEVAAANIDYKHLLYFENGILCNDTYSPR